MYTVWCEWDIGIEGKVFATKEVAEKHARDCLESSGIDESWEECRAEGLIGFDSVEIYYD